MKTYPIVPYYNKGILGTYVYAFDKLDGSNIRAEYNQKHGFNKFGTRKQLIGINDPTWGQAISLFQNKYSEGLCKIFKDDKQYKNYKKITVFFEYFGENSFAGWHDPNDKMNVVLFDVDIFQKGLTKPKDFIKIYGHLGIPDIVYEGIYNQSLIQDVKNNIYNLNEGVVVKGTTKTKRKDIENVWMVKIKTQQWLDKLKNIHGDKKLLEELNGDITLL